MCSRDRRSLRAAAVNQQANRLQRMIQAPVRRLDFSDDRAGKAKTGSDEWENKQKLIHWFSPL